MLDEGTHVAEVYDVQDDSCRGQSSPLSWPASAREPCQILEILPALLGAPVVAGLIFGAHQAVGSASAVGRGVEVALGASDAVLNVAPGSFGSLEDPGLALRISEEAGQLGTVQTVAGECTRALPVGRR